MYGWSGGFGTVGPQLDTGYPVAGVDYDPALLGPATVFPQEEANGPVRVDLDWYARNATPNQAGKIPPPQTATQWLNANAGKVALGVAGFFALMVFAKAGR